MNSDIKRHINIWLVATTIAYAVCVGLFLLRSDINQTLLNRPFFFLTEKLIASVVGVSFMTGIIIYIEIISGVIVVKKLSEAPLALALYCSTVLYCMAWIWTYS